MLDGCSSSRDDLPGGWYFVLSGGGGAVFGAGFDGGAGAGAAFGAGVGAMAGVDLPESSDDDDALEGPATDLPSLNALTLLPRFVFDNVFFKGNGAGFDVEASASTACLRFLAASSSCKQCQ